MLGYQWLLEVFYSLKAHKVRTIFTGFGVMWAMLILVLLQGIGVGLYNGMVKRFYRYSDRVISIRYSRSSGAMYLTEALTDDLAGSVNVFEQVMPLFRTNRWVTYAQAVHKSAILGVRVGYEQLKRLECVEGRFFTERDGAQRLPVCILGCKIKMNLLGTPSAVGALLTIDGTMVRVIGVLEATAGMDDDAIIMSSSLFKALFPKDAESVDAIMATLAPTHNPIRAEAKIRAYLERRIHFEPPDQLYIDRCYNH